MLRAVVGQWAVRDESDAVVDPAALPLSDRLLVAIGDWGGFFDEIDGDLSDDMVAEEFLGQGFKIAHRLRQELKGRSIYYSHPQTGELVEIG